MKKSSVRILCFVMFISLFSITNGLNWVSFDIPHSTEVINENIGVMVYDKNRVELGLQSAWSRIHISFKSSGGVVLNIAASDSGDYPTDLGQKVVQSTVDYIVLSDKKVSIFILHEEHSFSSSEDPVFVNMDVKISKSLNFHTNEFIVFLISIFTYLIFRSRNKNWINERNISISQFDKIKAKRAYQSNHIWCDFCGMAFLGVNDVNTFPRYCSKSCLLMANNRIVSRLTYFALFTALFVPWTFPIAILGSGLTIYAFEMDGEDMRYTRYFALRQAGNIKEDSNEGVQVVNVLPTKYVESLNEDFPICCYQTARLNEIYCECGRSIPVKLREYVETEVLYYNNLIDEEDPAKFQ